MGLESSPGSINEDDHGDQHDHGEHDKKRQPGVKRACNECRQQKVSQPLRPWHLPSVPASPFFPPAKSVPDMRGAKEKSKG